MLLRVLGSVLAMLNFIVGLELCNIGLQAAIAVIQTSFTSTVTVVTRGMKLRTLSAELCCMTGFLASTFSSFSLRK